MKTKLIFGFLFMNMMMLWTSCSNPCGETKEEFLEKYYALVETAEGLNLSISDDKWEDYDRDFRKMVKECYGEYESELNIIEKTQFWWNAAAYMKARYGDQLIEQGGELWDLVERELNVLGEGNILENLGNQYNRVKGTVEGLWNSIFGSEEE